jgi:hypothetical protein
MVNDHLVTWPRHVELGGETRKTKTGSQSQLEKDRQFNSWIDICFALYGARENDNSEIGCLSED